MSFFKSLTDTAADLQDGGVEDVIAYLDKHQVSPQKKTSGYSMASFRYQQRKLENVVRVDGLVFDKDHGDKKRLRESFALLDTAGLTYVAGSTFSHTPEHPKLRTWIDVTRPIRPDEYARLWHAVDALFALGADTKTSDAGHFFFRPACPAGVKPFVRVRRGKPLDVDEVLRNAPPAAPVKRAPLSGGDWVSLVDGLAEGGRNDGLAQLAGLLFRSLPGALAARLIYMVNDSIARPLDEAEVSTIVASIARRETQRIQGAR